MRAIRAFAAMSCLAVSVWAFQNAYADAKLTQKDFDAEVQRYVESAVLLDPGDFRMPSASGATRQAVLAMTDATRGTLVRQLGQAAKTLVMSQAFGSAYETYIKTTHNAMNHGISVLDSTAEMNKAVAKGDLDAIEAATNKVMREAFIKGVIDRLPQVDSWDRNTLEMMAGIEPDLLDTSMPSTAAEKANVARAKTLLGDAKKQAATDLPKARTTYKSALMLVAGVQSQAQVASGTSDAQKREQQANYNRLALKPALKARLQAFVTLAKSVNFAAPTQMKNGKKVFVNAADERRSEMWKLLYRLGAGGTNAAVAVAQGWIAEL